MFVQGFGFKKLLKIFSPQGIKEVSDVWDNMKFNVNKYMKGTQERGVILGAVDEVLQNLDDNSMNLQSMSASRFIGPFLNTVQTWEKSLSLIGEVLEVRYHYCYSYSYPTILLNPDFRILYKSPLASKCS